MRSGRGIARACRALPAAVAAACVIAGAIPTPAAAQGQHRLTLRPLLPTAAESIRLFHPHYADRVRARVANASAAKRLRATAATASFTTDGVSIPVAVSTAYAPNPAVEQGYVNFLGGLVHGNELGNISVYIASPSQIEDDFCGSGALACYVGDEERMYVPGVNEHSDPPVQFLIAHEYGHHIELNRSDAPWSAFDRGGKRWGSYENVCSLERRRKIGTNYYNDPSEAFAESYADMQFPGVDFIYTDLLVPDQGAFKAIRADVLQPWGPRTVTLRGSSTKSFTLRTPLDGTASLDLSAAPGTSYRLRVLAGTHALQKRRVIHASAGGYTICGARSLTVQVARESGSGPFTLAATLP